MRIFAAAETAKFRARFGVASTGAQEDSVNV
jgi:hypothetical protein